VTLEPRFPNGHAHLLLIPQNDDDWKLLDLMFNGRKVVEIRRAVRDSEAMECVTIVLARETVSAAAPVPLPEGKNEPL
jgi:hypothetical protein